jgi:hypothetical protein
VGWCAALFKAVTTTVVTTRGVKTSAFFAFETGFGALFEAWLLFAEVATWSAVVKTTAIAITVAAEVASTWSWTATAEATACIGVVALATETVTTTAHGLAGFRHAGFGL